METNQNLLIAMPSDDELYEAFIDAIKNGVHENIKGIASKLWWFIGNAKDDIKWLLHVDPELWLQLDITVEKWDQILSSFIGKQSRLMKNTLKVLLSTVGASTFTAFVEKMKKNPEDVQVTTATLSRIMNIFFVNLSKKYLTQETEATIQEKISRLFI